MPLREIADETQRADDLRERLIESNQTQIEVDEAEEDRHGAADGWRSKTSLRRQHVEEMLLRQLMAAQGQRLSLEPPRMQDRMIAADDLIDLVRNYNPKTERMLIRAAYEYGWRDA